MYKLYWTEGTASFAPQAILEEGGLDYELVKIDTVRGEHRSSAYLAINPAGKVPSLILPDGEVMYEAAAICLHLAEHHNLDDLAPHAGHALRGQFLRSLFYLSCTVQEAYKQFYYPERYSTRPEDAVNIRAKSLDTLLEVWHPVDLHLAANGPYHLGERFSLVDIYMVMLLTWHPDTQGLLSVFPGVNKCYNLVCPKPAVSKCLGMQQRLSVGRI